MFISFVVGQEIDTRCQDLGKLISTASYLVNEGVIPDVAIKHRLPGETDRLIYRVYRGQGGVVVTEKSDDAEVILEQTNALQAGT